MIPHRGVPPAEKDIHAAAGLRRQSRSDVLQSTAAMAVRLLPVGPQAPLQPGLSAHGVSNRTGNHLSKPKHPWFVRRQGVRHGVGPAEILRSRRQGVPSLGGPAQMDALPGDGHRHLIGAGHQGTRTGEHPPRRQSRPQMEAKYPGNTAALQDPGPAQPLRPAGSLLGGLEQEQGVSRQLSKVRRRILRQSQGQGGMSIVPAGVHPSGVDRRIGQTGGLRHRQGVQIRPKGRRLCPPRVKKRTDAAGNRRGDLSAQRIQYRTHIRCGLRQAVVQFRDSVQAAAVIYDRRGHRTPSSLAARMYPTIPQPLPP